MGRHGYADRLSRRTRHLVTGIFFAASIGVAATIAIPQLASASETRAAFKLAMGPVSAPHKPSPPNTSDNTATCPFRKSYPRVPMMKARENRHGDRQRTPRLIG